MSLFLSRNNFLFKGRSIKKYVELTAFALILLCTACKREEDTVSVVPIPFEGATRVYYLAAEEMVWDYAPQGMNVFMGMEFDSMDSVYAVNLPTGPTPRIGRQNWKARYVEYTDSTFTTVKPIASEWQHLGVLGPVIRANVGDSIVVHFKNNTTIDADLHVHGLAYAKSSEGSPYNDGTDGEGTVISPGGSYVYHYFASERSGPTASQPSSLVWFYHSHVNMDESDVYAGLVGALLVTRKGAGDKDAKPLDVDREFITLFMVFNENSSLYLQKNIDTYCPGFTNPDPDDFEESNKKHSINGMFMGNLPGLTMKQGERVRWYVLGLGNEVDLHTPHWHGNTVLVNGERTDVLELLPASMKVADMIPDNPGTWAYHCHVTDHMTAGMTALYTVQ